MTPLGVVRHAFHPHNPRTLFQPPPRPCPPPPITRAVLDAAHANARRRPRPRFLTLSDAVHNAIRGLRDEAQRVGGRLGSPPEGRTSGQVSRLRRPRTVMSATAMSASRWHCATTAAGMRRQRVGRRKGGGRRRRQQAAKESHDSRLRCAICASHCWNDDVAQAVRWGYHRHRVTSDDKLAQSVKQGHVHLPDDLLGRHGSRHGRRSTEPLQRRERQRPLRLRTAAVILRRRHHRIAGRHEERRGRRDRRHAVRGTAQGREDVGPAADAGLRRKRHGRRRG